ncbi:MAG: glycerophosphodiester phosphodiesterase family protein [Bosea sp. (in: a-proteobacteria)]
MGGNTNKLHPSWLTARPIAHRGLHDRARGLIENSMGAAEAAVSHRFAIECDVQLTADGEAMVFHDFTLERLTAASGRVDALTAQVLAGVAMKDTADRIPTLSAFLARIAGRVPVVVEIKSRFDGDLRLTRRTAEVVRDFAGPVSLKSFDPAIVASLRTLTPDHPRGIVAMNDYNYPDYAHLDASARHAMANLLHFNESQPDFISWRVRDLPSAAPYLTRSALGLPLMTWTVRSADDRAKASAHADQMVFEGFVPEATR